MVVFHDFCAYQYSFGLSSVRGRREPTGRMRGGRRRIGGPLAKHVVGLASEIAPGGRRVVTVRGRPIVIFNLKGEFFALLNRCPHQSAELSRGIVSGISEAELPGQVRYSRGGEFIRCPWHGWEFDIRTGQSYCDPGSIMVRQYAIGVVSGEALAKGPFVAETFPVTVEDEYLVVDV